jgi:hypothetical protein
MPLKGFVITDANLPEPKTIDDDCLRAIFDAFAFEFERRDAAKKWILNLIREWHLLMREVRLRPSRDADRQKIEDAVGRIRQASELLSGIGPVGRASLRSAMPLPVSRMLNTRWLREKFPEEEALPPPSTGRAEMRSGLRSRQVYIEEDTEKGRYHAVKHSPSRTLAAILQEIEVALSQSLAVTKEAGGRRPTTLREFFIVNLCEAWRIGGKPLEMSQELVDFCAAIFEGIGWPDRGLKAACRKAFIAYKDRIRN